MFKQSVYWLRDKFIAWTQHLLSIDMRWFGWFVWLQFLCIAEDEHITSEWKCSFCSSGPCWCYVILVFVVAVFICAASLFSLFHRYIVAGAKICGCPPQLQVERAVKHRKTWCSLNANNCEIHWIWYFNRQTVYRFVVPSICLRFGALGITWREKISAAKKVHHAQLQILPINHVCVTDWVTNQNTKYTLIYSVFLVDHLRFGFVCCFGHNAWAHQLHHWQCVAAVVVAAAADTKSKCKTTKFLELQVDFFLLEWIIDMNVSGEAAKTNNNDENRTWLRCAVLCAYEFQPQRHRWQIEKQAVQGERRENNCDKTNDESKKSPMTITILCLRNRLSTFQTEWFLFLKYQSECYGYISQSIWFESFSPKNDGELFFFSTPSRERCTARHNERNNYKWLPAKEHILCICAWRSMLIYHRSTAIHSKYLKHAVNMPIEPAYKNKGVQNQPN